MVVFAVAGGAAVDGAAHEGRGLVPFDGDFADGPDAHFTVLDLGEPTQVLELGIALVAVLGVLADAGGDAGGL